MQIVRNFTNVDTREITHTLYSWYTTYYPYVYVCTLTCDYPQRVSLHEGYRGVDIKLLVLHPTDLLPVKVVSSKSSSSLTQNLI